MNNLLKNNRLADGKNVGTDNDGKQSVSDAEFIREKILLAVTGICTGIANGFFGGGGGMIVVPMLVFLLGREPRRAHATALLVILPISVISGFIYASFGKFSFSVGLTAGLGVIAGGAIGALILKRISGSLLTKIFAAVMFAAGVKLLFF